MTATTLPLSFSKHLSKTSDSPYDEFGAHSIPPNTSGYDFDEEIVPTLKRRLEEESLRLENRINRIESHREGSLASKQIGRPIPRLDRNNEIIQDGLGSDDLIPSEWATGSSAQFAKLTPRGRSRIDENGARLAISTQHMPASNYSPPLHQRQATMGPPSPLSHSGSSQTSFVQEAPPSPVVGEAVYKARERARKLAKDRERMAMEQQMSMGMQDGSTYHWQGQGEDEEEEEEQGNGGESRERIRTLSTPSAYRPDASVKKPRYPPSASRNQEPLMTRSTSKTSLRDDTPPSSKIPLPVSGSMSRYQDQYGSPSKDVHKSKSAGRLSNVTTPPHQDGLEEAINFSQTNSSPLEKRLMARKPKQKLEYSPPTQDVLDEFGPLGGTPKRMRGPGWGNNEEGLRAVSDSRTVSNPWDEEMLPTVKKRLEQQRILDEMSRDDGFVDTWDRNGMPLSRSPIQLRQRSRIERGQPLQPDQQQQPAIPPEDNKQDDPTDEESVQRMKRLQEQLYMGIGDPSKPPQQPNHIHNDDRNTAAMEMNEVKKKERAHKSSNKADLRQNNAPAIASSQVDQKGRTNKGAIDKKESLPADDAGCCKCTIM